MHISSLTINVFVLLKILDKTPMVLLLYFFQIGV